MSFLGHRPLLIFHQEKRISLIILSFWYFTSIVDYLWLPEFESFWRWCLIFFIVIHTIKQEVTRPTIRQIQSRSIPQGFHSKCLLDDPTIWSFSIKTRDRKTISLSWRVKEFLKFWFIASGLVLRTYESHWAFLIVITGSRIFKRILELANSLGQRDCIKFCWNLGGFINNNRDTFEAAHEIQLFISIFKVNRQFPPSITL